MAKAIVDLEVLRKYLPKDEIAKITLATVSKNTRGNIYWDNSNRSSGGWRAEIVISGKRYRKRSKDKAKLERWLQTLLEVLKIEDVKSLFDFYWMIYPASRRKDYERALHSFNKSKNFVPDIVIFYGILRYFLKKEKTLPSIVDFFHNRKWEKLNSSVLEKIENKRERLKLLAEERIKKYWRIHGY
ncbi:MAG: hypothetical protein LBU89_00730 [Fibromonadaceae bacterium]|nr:hypothetical protein [Fibromonadaceae bacterium]